MNGVPAQNVEHAIEPGDEGPGGGAAAAADPSPDYVEYPDGARPELVREMKESVPVTPLAQAVSAQGSVVESHKVISKRKNQVGPR